MEIEVGLLGFLASSLGWSYLTHYSRKSGIKNRIQTFLDTWVNAGTLPCAQLVIYKGNKEVFYGSAGVLNAKNDPISRDSIFRIYSMTKPITIVAALILIERGVLALDQPVSKWIPSFSQMRVFLGGDDVTPITEPVRRDITIKDLMMHTSGITYGIFGGGPVDKMLVKLIGEDYKVWYRNTSLEALCDAVGRSPLSFQPGEKWLYGLSTDVLGRVIEVASGQTLATFFEREVFTPLGMNSTGFQVSPEDMYRLADCYEFTGVVSPSSYTPSLSPERDRSSHPTLLSGGGGLVSTIDDYTKFARCLLNRGSYRSADLRMNQLLRPETIALMGQNHLPGGRNLKDLAIDGFSESVGDGVGFGLGVSVITNPSVASGGKLSGVGEFGWGGVASTWFCIDPEEDMCAVFFTQVIPSARALIRPQLRWLAHWACRQS